MTARRTPPGEGSKVNRVTPPAYWAALSTRLATTRSMRRLSTMRRRPSTAGSISTGTWPTPAAWAASWTSSPTSTSSSSSSAHPVATRLISDRTQTVHGGIDIHRDVADTGALGRFVDEFAHLDLVEQQLGRSGVDPADF